MKEHEGPIDEVPKSRFWMFLKQPVRFTVGEPRLLRFSSIGAGSHKLFDLEADKAYAVMCGQEINSGLFDTELTVIFRKKGTAKLTIRTAHESSL